MDGRLFLLTSSITMVTVVMGCSTTHHVSRPRTVDDLVTLARGSVTSLDVSYQVAPARTASAPVPPEQVAASEPVRGVGALFTLQVVDGRLDGLWLAREREGSPVYLKLDDVRSVKVRRRGLGALEGLGFGVLTGAAVGAFAGYARGDDPPCTDGGVLFSGCPLHNSAGEKALIGGVVVGLAGALIGPVLGALIGHTERYVF